MQHESRAKARGSGSTSHTGVSIHPKSLYPHVQTVHADGARLNFPQASQTVLHQSIEDRIFPSTTSTANILSGGFVDIRIPAGSIEVVKSLTLELTITNSSGATVVPAQGATNAPGQLLLERVEILAEGGSQLISRHEGYTGLFLSDYRHLDPVASNYLRQASDVGASILAGGVSVVYIPILWSSLNNVYIGGFRADCYLRCWFRGAAAWQTAATIPTLSSLNLIVGQDNLGPKEQQALNERARTTVLDYRFSRPSFQVLQETMAAGGRYQWQLSAVHGLISTMMITVQLTSSTGSALTTMIEPAKVELMDSSGQSIIGGGPLGGEYIRLIKASHQSSNPDTPVGPLFLDFGATRACLEHGSLPGYIVGDGALQLSLTMPAGMASGAYTVKVDYYAAARMRVAHGTVEVLPS
jgi:hypothetical protein